MNSAAASAAAVLGGLLLATSFEPFGLTVGILAGPACLMVALQGRTRRDSILVGFVFGVAFQGALLIWLAQSIGPAAWVALVLVQACWFGVLGLFVRLLSGLPGAAIWFAIGWTGVEQARSAWPFGGLPWGRLGGQVLDTPWAATLPYLGVTATGLCISLAAGMIGMVILAQGRARWGRLAALGAVVGVGLVPLAAPYPAVDAGSMTVAVVQGGVPGDGRQLVANHREVTDNHVEATRELAELVELGGESRPDLVVWPENSTAVDPFTDATARADIEVAVASVDVPVIVGGMVDGPTPRNVLNQGIVWTSEGPAAARYTKHHPVPFGEYIPFRGLLGRMSSRFDEIPRDMLPGTSSAPLDVSGVRIADAICFDVAYDDVLAPQIRRGAQLIVVQTSNASFTGTSQLDQQFAITRVRAIETGRAIAVASTNGISAIIGPDGTVVERAPLRETGVLVARVPLREARTPAVRFGGEVATGVMLVGLLGVLVAGAQAATTRRGRGRRGRLLTPGLSK
ncbi:apolipoprotein N-acyltransferase [Nocardioides sp. T2.26MG-1]|uniref:apolipoprotein N-acyltransferase n=1 Tax=Nocardioides sp. T2.26MG-1 TaxID=3041166 RepID=UPI0024779DE1|nr:apolipoprotein N-acyltransferase [Nocardioides sp. T2.26MG-1]CAI9419309.1 Apolipoprotein N-acyltransferase [Nocardioides sp. T2.26MG-1]